MRLMSDQKSNDNKVKAKTILKLRKKQQIRFKQYWKQLQRENSELIHWMIQQMKSSLEQRNIQNIRTLKFLLEEAKKGDGMIPKLKQLAAQLIQILKTTILDELENMSVGQRQFYQEVRKMSIRLPENSKKKGYSKRLSDPTIEELFHLDVASFLLQQNQSYKKEFWHFLNLWTSQELSEISLLKIKAQKLYQIHQYYSNYLRPNNNHRKINDIITVLSLARIRARLSNFLNQQTRYPYLLEIEKERQQRQRAERENNDNQPYFKFNFSQLANLLIANQLQWPPSSRKAQFYQILRSIMKQQSIWEKKYLILSTKIKYSISIQAILQSLSYFQQMDQQQFTQHLEKAEQEQNLAKSEQARAEMMCTKFMNFQDTWKCMFLKDYSFQEAFEKSGMREEFCQGFSAINKCYYIRYYMRDYLFAASLASFNEYSQNLQAFLFFQSIIRPLIAIKTYELAYSNTRTRPISQAQRDDQSRTLILATINTKVLFFYLLKGKVSPQEYFQTIRVGLKSNPVHSKFTVILFEFNFKQNYNIFLKENKQFVNYLGSCYDSRAYLSSENKYCTFNLFIYANLHCHLEMISKELTKEKFHETLEVEVNNKLTIFKMINYECINI